MEKNTRSRKWLLTINNPIEKGYTHERLSEILSEFRGLLYWCMSDEVGQEGTYHTHIFFCVQNPVKFSTLKNRFDGAHFDMCRGTSRENRDYVFKEGKWIEDKKHETNLPETHEEFGELPTERPGKRTDLSNLYAMIKDGLSNYEIIEAAPSFLFRLDEIERVRQMLRDEFYKKEFRTLNVSYFFGPTGSGKTRFVMDEYGYDNVFRVTDYKHPFDGYKGQDVVIFEEFRSSLPVQDMLNYLDGYPLQLPCRYNNKVACFTKVFIVTNIQLESQYRLVQHEFQETWKAFLRRVHSVVQFFDDGSKAEFLSAKNYLESGPLEHVFKEEK